MIDFVQKLKSGDEVITAWSGIPDFMVCETLLIAGYDTVTIDMQHGSHTLESTIACVTSAKAFGKRLVSRIPVGDWGLASRLLDVGAAAIIAPMINTVEDAQAFAGAMKYPPIGARSWGPTRVMALEEEQDGNTFLKRANSNTLSIAMIETPQALDNLDEILGVPGIDGIFVGPSDLSVTFSGGAGVAPFNDQTMPVIEDIAKRVTAAGKIPCIFINAHREIAIARQLGYKLMAYGIDSNFVADGARAFLSEAQS
ncbi:MAG: 2,4-dihydroxyhept-2-ene-1,7-dioic acid aldolase [Rhizobiales bacterium]|nr:2,4-dihydroxyhept-2-ene-1,7-dioic acid aldolase [Hyphomicrobiales bacterium]